MTITDTAEQFVPFDPADLEDSVQGDVADPFPKMAELLAESPVHVGYIDFREQPHDVSFDALRNSDIEPVTVLGFDESVQVLRDNETFSNSIYDSVIGMVMGRTILQMDEPEHRMQRALVAPAFRSKMLERWEENLVKVIADELIDRFIDQGRADLVRDFTFNFPVQVIARILGLPRSDFPLFQRRAFEVISVAANWERGVAASEALREYFSAVLAERRVEPGDDLITELVNVEVDGAKLSDEEIYSFLRLLLPAGVETTFRASGSLLYALLTNPDQLAALDSDRELFPQAFEEAVRWEPPVTVILRRAVRDTELAGVKIPKGADLAMLLGAANRDPRKYENPNDYDMFRKSHQHIGFGFGTHVCLGMHLARMESRVAICALLDRVRDLKLDPAPGQDVHIHGLAFRSPNALPVSFTPA